MHLRSSVPEIVLSGSQGGKRGSVSGAAASEGATGVKNCQRGSRLQSEKSALAFTGRFFKLCIIAMNARAASICQVLFSRPSGRLRKNFLCPVRDDSPLDF